MACCIVPGCKEKSGDNNKLQFFGIPAQPFWRRQAFIAAIGRPNWVPSNLSRICGLHFLDCIKSDDVNSLSYLPTRNLPFSIKLEKTIKMGSIINTDKQVPCNDLESPALCLESCPNTVEKTTTENIEIPLPPIDRVNMSSSSPYTIVNQATSSSQMRRVNRTSQKRRVNRTSSQKRRNRTSLQKRRENRTLPQNDKLNLSPQNNRINVGCPLLQNRVAPLEGLESKENEDPDVAHLSTLDNLNNYSRNYDLTFSTAKYSSRSSFSDDSLDSDDAGSVYTPSVASTSSSESLHFYDKRWGNMIPKGPLSSKKKPHVAGNLPPELIMDVFIDDELPGVASQTDLDFKKGKDVQCQTTLLWNLFSEHSKKFKTTKSSNNSCLNLSRTESQMLGSLMDIDDLKSKKPLFDKSCQTDLKISIDQECQTNSLIAAIIPWLPLSAVRDNDVFPSFSSVVNSIRTVAKPEIELISHYIICLQNQIQVLNDKLVTMQSQVTEHEEVLKQITEIEDDSTSDTNVCIIDGDLDNENSIDFCTSSTCRVSSLKGLTPAIELGNGYYLVNGDDD